MSPYHASPIVSVIVGLQAPKTFHIHQQLLENNSHYFQAAARVWTADTITRTIELPEIEPVVFEVFALYVYNDRDLGTGDVHSLIPAYLVGVKLMADSFKELVADMIKSKLSGDRTFSVDEAMNLVRVVYAGTSRGDRLRQVLADHHKFVQSYTSNKEDTIPVNTGVEGIPFVGAPSQSYLQYSPSGPQCVLFESGWERVSGGAMPGTPYHRPAVAQSSSAFMLDNGAALYTINTTTAASFQARKCNVLTTKPATVSTSYNRPIYSFATKLSRGTIPFAKGPIQFPINPSASPYVVQPSILIINPATISTFHTNRTVALTQKPSTSSTRSQHHSREPAIRPHKPISSAQQSFLLASRSPIYIREPSILTPKRTAPNTNLNLRASDSSAIPALVLDKPKLRSSSNPLLQFRSEESAILTPKPRLDANRYTPAPPISTHRLPSGSSRPYLPSRSWTLSSILHRRQPIPNCAERAITTAAPGLRGAVLSFL